MRGGASLQVERSVALNLGKKIINKLEKYVNKII